MIQDKRNCWEETECGREPGGARAHERGPCPAAIDTTSDGLNAGRNAGRFCWAIPGTLCDERVQGTYRDKEASCRKCAFFRRVMYEEGPHFQLLKPALGVTDGDALHRRLNDAVLLITMYRDVFSCLAVRPLLNRITEHVVGITGCNAAGVYLLGDSGEGLLLEAHAGEMALPAEIDVDDDSPSAACLRSQNLCRGAAGLPGWPTPATMIATPIGAEQGSRGSLVLARSEGEFSPSDEWFLWEFALVAGLEMNTWRQLDSLRDLRNIDKAKSKFVALLMHHISSPLATIACSIQAIAQLGNQLKDDDRQELIKNSLERINSIQGLSRRLLDLAAIRSGKSLGDVRPVRPVEALQQQISARQAAARGNDVEIVVTDRAGPARIMADPDGLRVIFGNLLGNAIKYSTGPGQQVDVDLAVEDGDLRMCIRDRGIGIPAEEKAKIFEEFHRAANVTEAQARASGFGLGLTVVKELVDRYEGRLELESEVGVGTSVILRFPTADDTESAVPGSP